MKTQWIRDNDSLHSKINNFEALIIQRKFGKRFFVCSVVEHTKEGTMIEKTGMVMGNLEQLKKWGEKKVDTLVNESKKN